jgi:hypothetical protein
LLSRNHAKHLLSRTRIGTHEHVIPRFSCAITRIQIAKRFSTRGVSSVKIIVVPSRERGYLGVRKQRRVRGLTYFLDKLKPLVVLSCWDGASKGSTYGRCLNCAACMRARWKRIQICHDTRRTQHLSSRSMWPYVLVDLLFCGYLSRSLLLDTNRF